MEKKTDHLMRPEREGELDCFRFAHLLHLDGVRHAVFGRQGGVSRGAYRSLNVSYGCGDDPACVAENRRRIARWSGAQDVVYLNQVHGDRVLVLKAGCTAAPAGKQEPPATADAVVTDIEHKFLAIQVADCQAVLMYDPQCRVIANVHCGWRGSVQNILQKTVRVMADAFGCRAPDIRAGIGPSLGPCCAEFVNYRLELPPAFHRYMLRGRRFDFWAISRHQLLAAGLAEPHITVGGRCTRCDSRHFYSYRARRITGRFAAVIGLAG